MWAVQIGLLPGRVVMCCVRSVGEGSLGGIHLGSFGAGKMLERNGVCWEKLGRF